MLIFARNGSLVGHVGNVIGCVIGVYKIKAFQEYHSVLLTRNRTFPNYSRSIDPGIEEYLSMICFIKQLSIYVHGLLDTYRKLSISVYFTLHMDASAQRFALKFYKVKPKTFSISVKMESLI